MGVTSVLFLVLIVSCVFGQEDWNNWNPSPPLGPRPSPPSLPPPPQYQLLLAQWCQGCITRCLMWRNHDFGECATTCQCPISPRFVTQSPFLSSDEPNGTCDKGYAPTPILRAADDFHVKRRVKKNVVLFLLDDLDEAISPYWQAMPFSKTLFQDNGVKFTNAFSSTSVCCAARCQILVGLYGHNVGVLANAGKYGGVDGFKHPYNANYARMKDKEGRCINNENRVFPLMLQQAGYKTAVWGKYMNGFENDNSWALNYPVPPGWNEFVIPSSRNFYAGYDYVLTDWNSTRDPTDVSYEWRGLTPADYFTDVIANKAASWVDKMRKLYGNVPLFVYLNPSAPHFPVTAAPRHKQFAGQWNDLYNTTVPVRPNWNENVSTKPFWLRNNAALRSQLVNSPWFRLDFVKRMGSLMAVDEMIQTVYNKFAAIGELDNTVFIMTSDNGYNLGAHTLTHKMAPYEESIRVPLYFSGGGVFSGITITEPALLIDLAPTILDFANLESPSYMDGKSWWRNLVMRPESSAERQRNEVLLQYKKYTPGEDANGIASEAVPALFAILPDYFALDLPPYTAIRKDNLLFVEWVHEYDNGTIAMEYETYNIEADPYELNNRITSLHHHEFNQYLDQLSHLASCSGDRCW